MNLVYGHSDFVEQYVDKRVFDTGRGFGECQGVGVANNKGVVVGGYVYHNWCPEQGTIEISGAADDTNWLDITVLRAMFNYPFDTGNRMVIMRVSENNKGLLKMLRKIGFKFYTIPELRGPSESEIICTLVAADWHKSKFYKESQNG